MPAAASRCALKLVDSKPNRREVLLENASQLRDRLRSLGWQIGECESQIIPVIVGGDEAAMRVSERLGKRGVFAPGIRPPTVPRGQALIRISLSYDHSQDQIDQLIVALGRPRE